MSVKYLMCAFVFVAAVGTSAAGAECTAPAPSAIPDGTTATEAEMLAAMKAFKQYDAAANQYIKCLEEETAQAIMRRLSDRAALKERQAQAHNAVVDELHQAAGRFNKQVRIFKDRVKS